MSSSHGIILLDSDEIILRIYQATEKEWQLLYFVKKELGKTTTADTSKTGAIAKIITDFFTEAYTQQVLDWHVCARELSADHVEKIASATGLRIESIDKSREQELLCKGIFTEVW